MDTITIQIYKSVDEPGYFYDIFDKEVDDLEGDEALDGGHCTTTIENALEMAMDMAKEIIAKQKQKSPLREMAEKEANMLQVALVRLNEDEPMDSDQVEEFSMMLQEEINKLMGNV